MSRQPLLMWRNATAKRRPNAIEDLDAFDRNMGSVKFDVSVYATGITFMHNRYSCLEMGDIACEFERAGPLPKGDITPKQNRRNRNTHRKVTARGKIKYNPDNLYVVHLWIPVGENKRWVELKCDNPDMKGVPLWLHEKYMASAKLEADQFCSREEQSVFRATLFDMVANATEKSTQKQRKLLARALANEDVAKSLKRHVEMIPEVDALDGLGPPSVADVDHEDVHPFALDTAFESAGLAGAARKDALETTPRPRRAHGKPPRTWAEIQRSRSRKLPSRSRVAEASTIGAPGDEGAGGRNPAPKRAPRRRSIIKIKEN